jgi:hypothetical protein
MRGLRIASMPVALAAALLWAGAGTSLAVTRTFGPDGYNSFLRVPPGVIAVDLTAVGAAGGSGCAPGGRGAALSATVAVAPGEELRGEVGGDGEAGETVSGWAPCEGGVGSGWRNPEPGRGGAAGLFGGGSAGGGATWITAGAEGSGCCILKDPWGGGRLLLVAGGGGGGGFRPGADGGDAGAAGKPGGSPGGEGGKGGEGASAGAAGAGGEPGKGPECGGEGRPGWPGMLGAGGEGGSAQSGEVKEPLGAGGAGGGAGYYGGGGGGGGADAEGHSASALSCAGSGGGGGGSSFVLAGPLLAVPTSQPPSLTISYSVLAPPTISIASPADGSVYEQGARVAARFSCSDAPGGPGLSSCSAQNAFTNPAWQLTGTAPGALLFTARPGRYSLAVDAESADRLRAGLGSFYDVVAEGTLARPTLSGVSQSRTRWRAGTRPARLASARRSRVGTTFSFSLSVAARLRLTFLRSRGGTLVAAGHLSLRAPKGGDRLAFDGVLAGGRRLAPGSYEVTFLATDAAGSSLPRALRFRVL